MRVVLVFGFAALMSGPTVACNEQLFTVELWDAATSQDGRNVRTDVTVDLNYEGDRTYRMIHGAVLFSDVIGNALVTVPIERDASVAPNDEISAAGSFIGRDSRITTINRGDVLTRTCVWSIVYDDGTVERFD